MTVLRAVAGDHGRQTVMGSTRRVYDDGEAEGIGGDTAAAGVLVADGFRERFVRPYTIRWPPLVAHIRGSYGFETWCS